MLKLKVLMVSACCLTTAICSGYDYNIVDTGQTSYYDAEKEIPPPQKGEPYYGQDAQYAGNAPKYSDKGDGTVQDEVTGLMWTKSYRVLPLSEARKYAVECRIGGYSDWRLPEIKELYSLILFSGTDVSSREMNSAPENAKPFIDTKFFDFKYALCGERIIDSQFASGTLYTGKTMHNDDSVFGVNFADGRIKAYPIFMRRENTDKKFGVYLVRGGNSYGKNKFKDNSDGTISDEATGLMWSKADSKKGFTFPGALAYAEEMNSEKYLGHSDWRVPNAKELQSIVDYKRSPAKTRSAAIDEIFDITKLRDGTYPYFWSSTTHLKARGESASNAVYIAFGVGKGLLKLRGQNELSPIDAHGAGCQRAERKVETPDRIGKGFGPQGDLVSGSNFVRLVRDIR